MADEVTCSGSSEPYLVRWTAKYGRFVATGFVTPKEFADTLYGHLGGATPPVPEVVADMVAALPQEARPVMVAALSAVVSPEFYYPYSLLLPVGHPEREPRQHQGLARAREWAEALLAALSDATPG
jgi:hypothetical protein